MAVLTTLFQFQNLTTIALTFPAPPVSMNFLNALFAPIQCTLQSIRFAFIFILLNGLFSAFASLGLFNFLAMSRYMFICE